MPGCLAPGASTARAGQPGGGVLGGFGGACACVGRRRHPRSHARPCPQVQTFGEVRVGLCHGHQIVPPGDRAMAAALQRKLDVDVLILGDTHKFQAYRHEGRFVISPGSATGAFTPSLPKPTPSFVLMDVNGPRVRLGRGEEGEGGGAGAWLLGCMARAWSGLGEEGRGCVATHTPARVFARQCCGTRLGRAGLTCAGPVTLSNGLCTDLASAQVTVFVYELVDGEVKVDKIEFTKPAPPGKEL